VSEELSKNQVLARLPQGVRDSAITLLRREELTPWQLLRDEKEPVTRVYFPVDAVISIVSLMEDGGIAESYTAGRDGVAGWEVVQGDECLIFRSMCQIPGVCYSMDASDFRGLVQRDAAWSDAINAYAHCILEFAGRSGACNLLHQLVERCARWLLISHDRVGKDTFELTQEILSTMLGVHRPAVSVAAGTLQKAGLIRYTRGRITIKNRLGLEEASCECYRVVADEFCRVLGGPQPLRP
jgi:CRP-like cAMP-binding protein